MSVGLIVVLAEAVKRRERNSYTTEPPCGINRGHVKVTVGLVVVKD